jgi:hypothetical protein
MWGWWYYRAFSSQLEKNGFREGQTSSSNIAPSTIPRGPFVAAAELVRAQPDLARDRWPRKSPCKQS